MFERTALPSGPRVISARLPGARSVSIAAYVLAGSRLETPAEAGVAHFMEHITFKGTARFPSTRAISEAIEGVGGSFNAATDRESTVYWVRVPRREATRAMDVLGELIVRPTLDDDEIDGERAVIVEEIRSYLDDPAEYAQILFQQAMFGDGPLGREICGDEAGIRSLPAETIRDFWRATYRPANTVVAVAGDLGHDEAVDLAADGVRHRQRRRPGVRARRRRCRPARGSCSAPGATRSRRSSSSACRASAATTPTRGSCRSSTRSSATGCRAGSSCRSARSSGSPTTSRRASSTTPTRARVEVSAGVDPAGLPGGARRDPRRARPAPRRGRPGRRAGQGQGVPLRRARAADGRDPPPGVVDRRPGGAPRPRPDARGGARRGRGGRARRTSGASPRELFTDDGPAAGGRRAGALRRAASSAGCGCRRDASGDRRRPTDAIAVDPDERAAGPRPRPRSTSGWARSGLARAELESAGRPRTASTTRAIRDLAEARWRTGDLPGAGEAATAYLEIHPDDVLGLVIAPSSRRRSAGPARRGGSPAGR